MATLVRGYREFQRAIARADADSRREVKTVFTKAGDVVRVDAAARIGDKSRKSQAGLRTRVVQRGVFVTQRLAKTTGQHPEWGAWQMRHALLPALFHNAAVVQRNMEKALDEIADHFDT